MTDLAERIAEKIAATFVADELGIELYDNEIEMIAAIVRTELPPVRTAAFDEAIALLHRLRPRFMGELTENEQRLWRDWKADVVAALTTARDEKGEG
jgi:hypothetical protein